MVEAKQTRKEDQMTVSNKDRTEWAAAALRHYQSLTGSLYEDSLGDLLCDLMHFAQANKFDFNPALTRARGTYAEQFFEKEPDPPLTPYMATFHTPAGIVKELFHATSPEKALEAAKKFNEGPSFSEEDVEPVTEGHCVRQITITDEYGHQHSVWQTDEYRLQLAAPKLLKALENQIEATREIIDAWNNTDKVHGAVQDLINDIEQQSQSAREVIEAYENSHLGGAIEELEETLNENLAAIAQAKGGAA
jgi:hypothetical protein